MKPAPRYTKDSSGLPVPPLHNGDRLTQAEFHRRYEAYPEDVKFELVGGIVYMTSPLRRPHGSLHPKLSMAFTLYEAATPGVETLDNATTILGEESEPQPDLSLRILTEYGGQSRETTQQYIEGPPELVAEVAHSSEALDLHLKRTDYERAGVREYLVVLIAPRELRWFDFGSKRDIKPDRQGVWKSRAFPGLWVDGNALLEGNGPRLIEVVQQGLASRAHAAFVKRLGAARRRHQRGRM
jgi:Uma2 family endonuclease